MDLIAQYLILGTSLFWAIVIHEFGHWAYFTFVLNHPVEIRFSFTNFNKCSFKVGYPLDYKELELGDKKNIYLAGIVAGVLPLMIAAYFTFWAYWLIPLYLYGCKSDIKKLFKK